MHGFRSKQYIYEYIYLYTHLFSLTLNEQRTHTLTITAEMFHFFRPTSPTYKPRMSLAKISFETFGAVCGSAGWLTGAAGF